MSLPEFKIDWEKDEDNDKPIEPKFEIIDYSIAGIIDKIKHLDSLNENEIKDIIIKQHDTILNYNLFLKSPESRKEAQYLFTNKKFLNIFIKVINILNLNNHEITCINKLSYDYYILPNKDSEVSDLLMQISNIVNYRLVIKLSAYLGMNGARILAMIRNSAFSIEKVVRRVNTFLVRCNIDLNAQAMVNIFCILFDHFTYPFTGTMLITRPEKMSTNEERNFNNISLAMLFMLDSMTSDAMRQVLSNYAFTIKLYNIDKVRFKIKDIKSYTRVQAIIRDIELDPIDTLVIP